MYDGLQKHILIYLILPVALGTRTEPTEILCLQLNGLNCPLICGHEMV
jgi:hypothetical protein